MTFISLDFFIFLSVFVPLYFLLQGKYRILFCLAGSYFFYAWWDWRFLSLLIISTVTDYVIARLMELNQGRFNRLLLIVSISINLGILGVFKYFNFFYESFSALVNNMGFGVSPITLNLILPLGISFYTFQTMSYTIDVYRKKLDVEKNFFIFAAYVSLFPQLVAGPIVRAKALLPQLRTSHSFDCTRIIRGLEMMVWGFFLKLCVADRLALVVDPPFENPEAFGGAAHITAIFGFGFQIYADFAGYSLIAIGLGLALGYHFGLNFRRPYLSASFSEFWERWHISLSSWLRDYIYIPLGGNRVGSVRMFRNLFIVMFLGGLWHGASWTFVAWGLLHALYLICQRLCSYLPLSKLPLILKIGIVYLCVNFAWIFFRAETFDQSIAILKQLFTADIFLLGFNYNLFALVVGYACVSIVFLIEVCAETKAVRLWYNASPWLRLFGMILTIWLIAFIGVFDGTTFIYFQF